MKSEKKISPPDWMTMPEAQAVMGSLNESGKQQTLFVGGCVRNAVLNRSVSDIDLATIHTPDDVMMRLKYADIRYIPTGVEHGTVTAIVKGQTFEITTLRRDVTTDGRRATVSYTDDWIEDARRRDFTMNTLLADRDGNIYDPLAQGLSDLALGRVIFVGDPQARIHEDYLRILRFFRFHAIYGNGAPNEEALRACAKNAGKIKTLSRERITQEILKILGIGQPAPVLGLMFGHGIMNELCGYDFDISLFENFCEIQSAYKCADIMARLGVIAGMDPDRTEDSLALSNAQKKAHRNFITLAVNDQNNSDNIHLMIYRHGRDVVKQILIWRMVGESSTPELRALFHIAETWNPPQFPLTGQDAMDLGIRPGPELGRKLKDVETWWIEQDFLPGRGECLKLLQQKL